jgi:hypothetical protein
MLLRHQTTDKLSDLRFIGCRALGPFSFPSNICLTNGWPTNFLSGFSQIRFPCNPGPRGAGNASGGHCGGRWRAIQSMASPSILGTGNHIGPTNEI